MGPQFYSVLRDPDCLCYTTDLDEYLHLKKTTIGCISLMKFIYCICCAMRVTRRGKEIANYKRQDFLRTVASCKTDWKYVRPRINQIPRTTLRFF